MFAVHRSKAGPKKSSRMSDWVNFNIKSLGGGGDQLGGPKSHGSLRTDHDSDSGYEQAPNDFTSLYVEPWTNVHEPINSPSINQSEDRVRIFVAGPSPKIRAKKMTSQHSIASSTGPNDERFYGKTFDFTLLYDNHLR
jgi:hypothetical protein